VGQVFNDSSKAAQFLLEVDKFFNVAKRYVDIEAMPFYVSTNKKNLKLDCQFIRTKNVEGNEIFHCVQEEMVEHYILTNCNVANCINCPYYIKEEK